MVSKIITLLYSILLYLSEIENNRTTRRRHALENKILSAKHAIFEMEWAGDPANADRLQFARLRLQELERQLADIPAANAPTDQGPAD